MHALQFVILLKIVMHGSNELLALFFCAQHDSSREEAKMCVRQKTDPSWLEACFMSDEVGECEILIT